MVGDEHSSPRRSTRGTTLLGAAVVLVPVGVLTILAIYAPDVVLALASPIILGGLGVWQLQAQLKANREMQAAQALRERKSRVYSQFVDLLIKQMLTEKQTEKKTSTEREAQWTETSTGTGHSEFRHKARPRPSPHPTPNPPHGRDGRVGIRRCAQEVGRVQEDRGRRGNE